MKFSRNVVLYKMYMLGSHVTFRVGIYSVIKKIKKED